MPRILRRTVLEWGVGLAAGSALAQGAKSEPVFKPEKDASLRLLRWSGFVKSDEELCGYIGRVSGPHKAPRITS